MVGWLIVISKVNSFRAVFFAHSYIPSQEETLRIRISAE
jgi:hypothetical protein